MRGAKDEPGGSFENVVPNSPNFASSENSHWHKNSCTQKFHTHVQAVGMKVGTTRRMVYYSNNKKP